ncbi:MAG: SLC26A/SulP transporter family protein [Verrucomicrobiales bacterium]|nr:SLC26A/SulP transporter family protein [Verrucomicrobiales bacterium]
MAKDSTTSQPPRVRVTDVVAGLVVGAVMAVTSQSLGALVFAGPMSGATSLGTSAALITALISGWIMAWRGSCPGTVSTPQERVAPVLALLTGVVAAEVPEGTPIEAQAATVLAAMAVTAMVVGAGLYFLGRMRLGNLTRYIPYPVMGGFLAGSGWLLLVGAVRVSTGVTSFTGGGAARWLEPRVLVQGILALALGVLLFVCLRFWRKPALFVALLVGAAPVLFLVSGAADFSVESLRQSGWLPEVVTGQMGLRDGWAQVWRGGIHWEVLPATGGIIGSVLVTSTLSILFNASGIELLVRSEADLNRELRTAGVANLVGGMAGGMVGFQSLNMSRLGHDLRGRGRTVPLVAASLCGLALLLGPSGAAFVPKVLLGGVLCCLGLGFLHDWLIRARRRLPKAEYVVVILILAVIGALGYVQGVVVGLMAALLLFVHNYSRVSVVTHSLTAADHPSRVDRPDAHRRILEERGGEVLVLRLQGFIFFGTANSIVQQIRSRAEADEDVSLRYVVLDFNRVSGLDSSAAFSLSRALQLAEKHRFEVILTQLSPEIRRQLREDVFRSDEGPCHRMMPTLDHGVEWCEERLLAEAKLEETTVVPLRAQLEKHWPHPEELADFLQHLDRMEIEAGAHLIRQGSAADALFFVESGQVSTVLETPSGDRRLRRQGPGTVVGELGLFLGVPRTASVIAEKPCVVYRLAARELEAMTVETPALAAQFYEFMTHFLAERVVSCNRVIRAFMD